MPGLCLGLLSMGCWQQDWGVRVPSRAAGPTPAHTCRVYRPARLHRAPSALFPASQRGLLPGCSGGAVTVQNRQRTALVSRWCEHGDGGSRPLPGASSQFGRHRCIPDPGHGCIYPPAVTPGAADSIRASHRPSWWHQPSARVWKLFLASLWPRNNISEKNQSLHVVFFFFFLLVLERSRCSQWEREPCARCRARCALAARWDGTQFGEMCGYGVAPGMGSPSHRSPICQGSRAAERLSAVQKRDWRRRAGASSAGEGNGLVRSCRHPGDPQSASPPANCAG